jgi:hypothetical protein
MSEDRNGSKLEQGCEVRLEGTISMLLGEHALVNIKIGDRVTETIRVRCDHLEGLVPERVNG